MYQDLFMTPLLQFGVVPTSLKRVVSRQFFTLLFYYMRAGQICEFEPRES